MKRPTDDLEWNLERPARVEPKKIAGEKPADGGTATETADGVSEKTPSSEETVKPGETGEVKSADGAASESAAGPTAKTAKSRFSKFKQTFGISLENGISHAVSEISDEYHDGKLGSMEEDIYYKRSFR